MTYTNEFPLGWDEQRVRRILDHYETQTGEQALAEDEVTCDEKSLTFSAVPSDMLDTIRQMIAKQKS